MKVTPSRPVVDLNLQLFASLRESGEDKTGSVLDGCKHGCFRAMKRRNPEEIFKDC